jgi:hypothetical protein
MGQAENRMPVREYEERRTRQEKEEDRCEKTG